ncbi:MogA/MoaB family molybdenum cofactor biosynthesis protein [Candidatus Thorarchaeota archaeon]|nr:MAG: MogA/MoaB family molybdenum cofactor biosynthesis protein [Candidatus Thorarchaeota archaeon]
MRDEHRRDQKVQTSFAVLVVSDTRTKETDKSGVVAQELITSEGHTTKVYEIVKNDKAQIIAAIKRYLRDPLIRVILTSGGTGVGRKDLTVDVVQPLFDKKLDGFGEHFRRLSLEEIGQSGIYSRATAGLVGKTVVFCLPGSKNAMTSALEKVILPSIGHLLWEVDR